MDSSSVDPGIGWIFRGFCRAALVGCGDLDSGAVHNNFVLIHW